MLCPCPLTVCYDVTGFIVNGFNSLHAASKKGHTEVVQLLLERFPALASSRTHDNRTACMLACFEGRLEVVKLYASRGVFAFSRNPINDIDPNNNLPYHYAAWGGHLQVVQFIMKAVQQRFTEAVTSCDVGSVDELNSNDTLYLRKLFHPLIPNKEGLTAVDMAAVGNHVEVIEYILTNLDKFQTGDDVDCVDDDEPIGSRQHKALVASTSSSQCQSGFSALHRAAQYGSLSAIRMLLSKCDDSSVSSSTNAATESMINSRGANGFTPLHLACLHGHTEIVGYLVSNRHADVNAKSTTLLTPLHTACVGGYVDIVRLLLAAGADPAAISEVSSSKFLMFRLEFC
jgi:ankyrin repeat protein